MQLRLPALRAVAAACLAAATLPCVSVGARAEEPADATTTDAAAPSPAAGEMLKSMREKGILSEEEYDDLYRRQAKYEEQQREKNALPGWMQNWTFGGDLRLR